MGVSRPLDGASVGPQRPLDGASVGPEPKAKPSASQQPQANNGPTTGPPQATNPTPRLKRNIAVLPRRAMNLLLPVQTQVANNMTAGL